MDKIGRIKRLVESSLDTSFGKELSIKELIIFPTQKFDENSNEWVSDSHTVFLTIEDNRLDKNPPDRRYTIFDSELGDLLESLLGYEFCIQIS